MRYTRLGPSSVLVGVVITEVGFTLSRLELGPSWVLVLRNALEITVEERPLALQMCPHDQDDRPETWLKNGLIFTSKWTTVWHQGMVHAVLNPHLPAFHSPIAIGEQRKHLLGVAAIVLNFHDDRPENSPKKSQFWTLNQP